MTWPFPPAGLELKGDEVHVWSASLELGEKQLRNLESTLSDDERARAARLRIPAVRRQVVASRGILRSILSRYLGTHPRSLEFAYGPYGKPHLRNRPDTLNFNLSHSHGLALYAVSHERSLGIDLEKIQPHLPYLELAGHFFAASERAALRALPTELQPQVFFAVWTHKEAYLKALGTGLFSSPQQFAVIFERGQPTLLQSSVETSLGANRWSFEALSPHPEYVAAVAVAGAKIAKLYEFKNLPNDVTPRPLTRGRVTRLPFYRGANDAKHF